MPNSPFQEKMDIVRHSIQKKLAHLEKVNIWLDSNGYGEWYQSLAIFLCKLPMRAVRNIIQSIYGVLRAVFYSCVHPIKALNKLIELVILSIYEITQPENWPRIGAGVLGTTLGQLTVTGLHAFIPLGLAVGSALLAAGITYEVAKAGIKAREREPLNAVKQALWNHLQAIPESFITGFFTGLIFGGIQKANTISSQPILTKEEANQYLSQYLKEHDIPKPCQHWYYPEEKSIIVSWCNKGPKIMPPDSWANPYPYSRIPLPTHYSYVNQTSIAMSSQVVTGMALQKRASIVS